MTVAKSGGGMGDIHKMGYSERYLEVLYGSHCALPSSKAGVFNISQFHKGLFTRAQENSIFLF